MTHKNILAASLLMAFSCAVSAQSSVTVYGKVDMGLTKSNSGNATLSGATGPRGEWAAEQGASSRLGFRGTEDLGGGYRASFVLEHRFNPDTGKQTAPEFFRQSWVELSGGFGGIRLGRDFTPAFAVAIAGDPFGFDTVAQAGPAHVLLGLSPTRFNNMVAYRTPKLGDVTATIAIAPSENAGTVEGGNGSKHKALGANFIYSSGPIYAGLGYENSGVQSPIGVKTNMWVLTAAYNFGVIRPSIMIGKGTAENLSGSDVADRTNVQLAATAPLGVGEVKFLIARRKDSQTHISIQKVGMGYHHALSKRTKLYVDIASASETNKERRTAVDFGIQTNF